MASSILCVFAFLAVAYSGVTAQIAPTQYTVSLYLDTANDVFSGSVEIDADVKRSGAMSFTLHNNGLSIATVSVAQGGTNIFSDITNDPAAQTTTISVSRGLSSSLKVLVAITFQGNVSTDPTGLFSFVDNGKKFYMTNFYPIYARKVFPCLDEPGNAAAVSLSLTVPNTDDRFIGSAPISKPASTKSGQRMFQLKTTAPIAPYSLFFTLGAWSNNDFQLPNPKTVLWLPPSLTGSNTNLLDDNIIKAFQTPNVTSMLALFTMDPVNVFITPKLDSDSYSGLNTIVLKKDSIVNDLSETTTEMMKDHLLKITTAIYRVFYGTIARPSTWGNAWIAEAIPKYLAYQTLDAVDTSYGTSDESLVTGLEESVLKSSWEQDSPVPYTAQELTKPDEILSFLRSTGAEKGVYAIKTLETFVDPKNLNSALLGYLTKCNMSTMETIDLTKYLQSSFKVSIIGGTLQDVFLPIVQQPGYPLITLGRNQFTLTMAKSNFDVKSAVANPSSVKTTQLNDVSGWLIPVTAATSMGPSTKNVSTYFIPSGNMNSPLALTGTYPENGWALLNIDGKGIMRVSYDPTSWLLFAAYGIPSFSTAMRAKLVTDAFATSESGTQDWTSSLDFLQYLDNEKELAPWTAALRGFNRMWSWIYQTGVKNSNTTGRMDLTGPFLNYMKARLTKIYKDLGTKGSSQQDPLRREIVAAMCQIDGENCVKDLSAQYQDLVNRVSNPSGDMFAVVVCNGIRGLTTAQDWNKVYTNYINSGKWYSQALKTSHYRFLACPNTNSGEVSAPIVEFLRKILINTQANQFPVDQVKTAVEAILDHPQHVDQVVGFFVNNQPFFNITIDLQVEIMTEIGKRLSSPTQAATLSDFVKAHPKLNPALSTAVNSSIAAANKKSAWVIKVQKDVLSGLNGNPPPSPTPVPTPSPSPTGTGPTSSPTPATPSGSSTKPPGGGASSFTISIFTLVAAAVLVKIAQ